MELADEPGDAEGRPGAGGGLHYGAETLELSPLSAILLAEMIDEADFPPGISIW